MTLMSGLEAARDSLLADAARLHALADALSAPAVLSSVVQFDAEMSGSDTVDAVPQMQALFRTRRYESKNLVFGGLGRRYVGLTRPTGEALGPQGQYLEYPQACSLEWVGSERWDFTAYSTSTDGFTGAPTYMRRQGRYGSAVAAAGSIARDATAIPLAAGGGAQLSAQGVGFGTRVLIRATLRWLDPVGGWTQADAVVSFTASISAATMVVTEAADGILAAGMQIGDNGVAEGTTIVSGPAEGGVGIYTVSISQTVASASLRASKGLNARAGGVRVWRIVGDTLYLLDRPQDDYDAACAPVVQPYLDPLKVTLINFSAIGPGIGPLVNGRTNDDRFFFGAMGEVNIVGGCIENFAQAVRLWSVTGRTRDLTMHGVKQTAPGGGLAIGDDTSGYLVDGCTSYGGGQMYMHSGSGSFWGVTRDLTFRSDRAYSPLNGFSTHSMARWVNWDLCRVDYSRSHAFDARVEFSLRNSKARGAAGDAVRLRGSPVGIIDNFEAEECLTGIEMETDGSPAYTRRGDLTIRNTRLTDIGGVGSHGAASFGCPPKINGAYPDLGSLRFCNVFASMTDNTVAILIRGPWTQPELVNVEVAAAAGATPVGSPLLIGAPTDGEESDAPSSPIISDFRYGASFPAPSLVYTGRLEKRNVIVPSVTSSDIIAFPSGTVLTGRQSGGRFSNDGATGPATFTLPLASTKASYKIFVSSSFETKIESIGLNQILVGSASPVLDLTLSARGAWAEIEALANDAWSITLSAAADSTSGWSPYDMATDLELWLGQAPAYISDTSHIVTRWVDLQGGGLVAAQDTLGPALGALSMDFAGNRYLTEETPPTGLLPINDEPGCLYAIVKQTTSPADTTEKIIVSCGGVSKLARALGRQVYSGVNRAVALIGDGSATTTVVNTAVDFSGGWHWLKLKCTGTAATLTVDGVASGSTAIVPATSNDRFRVGAGSAGTAASFWNDKIETVMATVLSPADEADLEQWLTDRVALLNDLGA